MQFALYGATLAENIYSRLKVGPRRYCHRERPQTAACKFQADGPMMRSGILPPARLQCDDRPGKEMRGVEKVAAVSEQKIFSLIGLRILRRLALSRTLNRNRLQVIGHRVSRNGIAIPAMKQRYRADLVVNELPGERYSGIETAVQADLQFQRTRVHPALQSLAFFDAESERLLYKNMLAGGNRL